MIIVVRFLLDDGSVQRGELVNPYEIVDRQVKIHDHVDGFVDILVTDFDGTAYIFQTHISCVAHISAKEVVPV